jgi:hypothetical protein
MKQMLSRLILSACLMAGVSAPAHAEVMDWVTAEKFDDTMWPYRVDHGLQPRDLAVRVAGGKAEYKIVWQEYEGGFSDAIFTPQSREEAEGLIRAHKNPENAHMLGGDPKLCLHKFARAVDGGTEYFLMYMVDPDNSGLRCISLPAQ